MSRPEAWHTPQRESVPSAASGSLRPTTADEPSPDHDGARPGHPQPGGVRCARARRLVDGQPRDQGDRRLPLTGTPRGGRETVNVGGTLGMVATALLVLGLLAGLVLVAIGVTSSPAP